MGARAGQDPGEQQAEVGEGQSHPVGHGLRGDGQGLGRFLMGEAMPTHQLDRLAVARPRGREGFAESRVVLQHLGMVVGAIATLDVVGLP